MNLSKNQERFGPAVLGAVLAAVCFLAVRYGLLPKLDKLGELFAASINISGIAIGFMATMKAILLGARDTATAKLLRDAKRWGSILGQIRWAILWAFLVAIASVFCLLVKPFSETNPSEYFCIPLLTWAFFVGGAIGSAYIVIDVLFKIVSED